MSKFKLLGISGSTKANSTAQAILEFVGNMYSGQIDLSIYSQLSKLPHFNPDLEKDLPAPVIELRRLIEAADGVIFCTPEYVFSLPGSLKNLIEWNVSTVLFSGKPVAMIVAAASGKKAFESLELILTTIECSLPAESKLLIQGAKGKLSITGVVEDQETVSQLNKVVLSLIRTIRDLSQEA